MLCADALWVCMHMPRHAARSLIGWCSCMQASSALSTGAAGAAAATGAMTVFAGSPNAALHIHDSAHKAAAGFCAMQREWCAVTRRLRKRCNSTACRGTPHGRTRWRTRWAPRRGRDAMAHQTAPVARRGLDPHSCACAGTLPASSWLLSRAYPRPATAAACTACMRPVRPHAPALPHSAPTPRQLPTRPPQRATP